MKRSAFIFLVLLVSSLSTVLAPEAKADTPSIPDVRRVGESFSITSKYSDFTATETVRTAVPSPTRAVRKQQERQQKRSCWIPDVFLGQHFSLTQCSHTDFLSVPGGKIVTPFHDADYIKFGILII